MIELPRIECAGTPLELGRAHGEALRPLILRFVAQRLDNLHVYLAERGSGDVAGFLDAGRRCLERARAWDPEGTAEHAGIAEAAGVDLAELYATTNMTDVRDIVLMPAPAAEREGCSALMVPPPLAREGGVIAAQTWDLNPTDIDYVVAVHRLPDDGPETWSITCAGCLSLIGMNEHGVSLGTTNIKVKGARIGVGYLSILHRAIREPSATAALDVIRNAPRAAAHTYWVADAQGGAELECSAGDSVERRLGERALARTNHCLSEPHRSAQGEQPNNSTFARLRRLETLLSARGQDADSVRRIFSDRADGVDSICRYPEDAQGTTTNACIVCLPEQRQIHACRGPADRGEWTQLPFSRRP